MYAIIRAGGHQEKVTAGEQITVDRLKAEPGQEVTFVPLLVAADDGTVVSDKAQLESSAKVVARVVDHVKGDKVHVFQYRQKTNYRRHVGHRQPLTLVEISEIRLGDTSVTADQAKAAEEEARRKAAEEKAAKVEEARKKREAEKAAKAEKKATAKPAAKKPAAKKTAAKSTAKAKKPAKGKE